MSPANARSITPSITTCSNSPAGALGAFGAANPAVTPEITATESACRAGDGRLSRRSLLGRGLAAAVPLAAGIPVAAMVSAPAAADDPDALLLDLGRRFDAAVLAYRAACDREGDAEEEYIRLTPDLPEALRFQEADQDDLSFSYRAKGDVDLEFYTRGEIQTFRKLQRLGHADVIVGGKRMKQASPSIDRVDQILAAWDRWEADCGTLADRLGLPSATAEVERILDDVFPPLMDAIMAAPATTMAGLAVKARAATWCLDRSYDLSEEDDFRLRALGSIARDLQRAAA